MSYEDKPKERKSFRVLLVVIPSVAILGGAMAVGEAVKDLTKAVAMATIANVEVAEKSTNRVVKAVTTPGLIDCRTNYTVKVKKLED